MKKRNLFPVVIVCLMCVVFFTGCKKDDDDPEFSELDLQINKFIWLGLHDYYLWVENVPNLSASKFSTEKDWNSFLSKYPDHEDFFYDMLYQYGSVDKWSWIVDDYEELENEFQGISVSMGYEFQFGRFSGTDNLFGVVMYVLKGSPAEAAGIKRGNIFIKINGQDITETNYIELMFENTQYSMSFGQISGGSIISNGKTVNLTAVQLQENPIFLDTVYNVDSKKIGYLVYNQFNAEFEIELNNVFKNFKTQNIDDLIIDLRYNPGGAITTATYLSSMIYSTDTNKVFCKTQYNAAYQKYVVDHYGSESLDVNFADKIEEYGSNPETSIESLGLNHIYVIVTEGTASASELLINGLKPYIDVVSIGTNTSGKYVGSFTIKDWDEDGNVNPNHKWALQPIVLKVANSNGESDYVDGLAPNISIEEDLDNMSELGNLNEPLLAKAISSITGETKSASKSVHSPFDFVSFGFSKDFKPFAKGMYLPEKEIKKQITF